MSHLPYYPNGLSNFKNRVSKAHGYTRRTPHVHVGVSCRLIDRQAEPTIRTGATHLNAAESSHSAAYIYEPRRCMRMCVVIRGHAGLEV